MWLNYFFIRNQNEMLGQTPKKVCFLAFHFDSLSLGFASLLEDLEDCSAKFMKWPIKRV